MTAPANLRIFHTMGLRVLTPALVTVFLFQLVGIWNNYFLPLVMLSDVELYPITLGLNNWLSQVDRLPEFYELTTGGVLLSDHPARHRHGHPAALLARRPHRRIS